MRPCLSILSGLLALTLSGCLYSPSVCAPEPTILVDLQPAGETARSRPGLAVMKTGRVGLDVPGANGEVRATLHLTNADSVEVTSLRFDAGTVTLHWRYEGCQLQTGVARLDIPGRR
jgi:starvation-inducible outer membrane lipoprotein